MHRRCTLILLTLLAGVQCSWASHIDFRDVTVGKLLRDVPNYFQSSNGCAPTTAAIILGYWDLYRYDNLFDASGWDDDEEVKGVRYTANVIGHITALADHMGTSTWSLAQGWTYIDEIDPGIEAFTASRGYTGTSAFQVGYFQAIWENYMFEINHGNPVFLLVDSDLDNTVDHAVAGIGYGTSAGKNVFGFYSSFSEDESNDNIWWYEFQQMKNTLAAGPYPEYGLYSQMITIHPPGAGPTPTPEPATIFLLASGLAAIAGSSRRTRAGVTGAPAR